MTNPSVFNVSRSDDIPRTPVDGKLTLVYWNIVCYAHAIRLALAYVGVEWVDVHIDPGDPSETSQYKQIWFDVKPEMASLLAFPNLPYFIDSTGAVAISQSDSILRYVGRQFFPPLEDETERITIDLVLDELKDQENAFTTAAYSGQEELDHWCDALLPGVLQRFSRMLERNSASGFLLSNKGPSIADFKLYQFLYRLPGVKYQYNRHANTTSSHRPLPTILQNFVQQIEALPAIRSYMDGPRFLPHPLHSPHAYYIGKEADAIL